MTRSRGVGRGGVLLFPTVMGFVGLFLGAAEGIMSRNLQRAAICAAVGLGIGFAGGFVALILAEIIFGIMGAIAVQFWKNPQQGQMPTGLAFLILMMGRAAAWAVAAIPAGIGQGIALRERKVVLNGLLGGVLGGLLGGIAFDPISLVFISADGQAWPSRAVGFTLIGLMVGLFVGIVEQWTKSAWLLMKAGPLAGKQFVIFRNPTVLGSAPKADVYLFKDEAIEPRHALIHDRGGRFEIEDMDTADGTYVNGIPVKRQILKSGDQIVLGKTVLEFALKETRMIGRVSLRFTERVFQACSLARDSGGACMPISFQCPRCGKKLKAPDTAVGKSSKCPGCGGPGDLPGAGLRRRSRRDDPARSRLELIRTPISTTTSPTPVVDPQPAADPRPRAGALARCAAR